MNIIKESWTNHQINKVDFTSTPAKVIDGCGYEIISLSALKLSHKNGKKKHRSELCSLYIRENKKKFICSEVITPNYLLREDLRLTIDFPEDLILCRAIYKNIKNKKLKKIIEFVDKNKNLNPEEQETKVLLVHSPADMPEAMHINFMEEPWINATIMTPDEYLGNVLDLCTQKRGVQKDLSYVGDRAMLIYRLPLNEIVYDFYDRLKSCSRGYASFDWQMDGYERSDLVKLSILVNAEPVDALSIIVHKTRAESRGRALCKKLKDLIPKQMFAIAIQAAIGGKIIARETVSAMRKDVTAKCYGGDITRKRKLLDKQKKGKKKMREIGNVEIPQSAFLAALRLDDE
jgi:hypothetical protein